MISEDVAAARARIEAEIAGATLLNLARAEQVRRDRVPSAERTAGTGELTPSMKPRRQAITVRYADEIGQLHQ